MSRRTAQAPLPNRGDRSTARELRRQLDRAGGQLTMATGALRAAFRGRALSHERRREIVRALASVGVDAYPPLDRGPIPGEVHLRVVGPIGSGHPAGDRARSLWVHARRRVFTPVNGAIMLAASLWTLGTVVVRSGGGAARRSAPAAMSGDVNVAVAPFTADGRATADGAALAQDAAAALRSRLPQLDASLHFDVRGPDGLGALAVPGALGQAARGKAMRALARAIGADVVVYGELAPSPTGTRLTPLFYLNTKKLPSAHTLAGGYGYGDAISTRYSIDVNPQARAALRRALIRRVEAYTAAVVGVGDYLTHSLTSAERFLRQARRAAPDAAAVPLLQLLLGNVAVQRRDLAAAARFYAIAARARATRARALFGLAEVRYARAHGSCRAGRVRPAALLGARAAFARIASAPDAAAAANPTLAAKVQFGLGQVDLCLSASGVEDRWRRAAREFAAVGRAYGGRVPELRDDAAEAEAGIGLSALALEDGRRGFLDARAAYATAASWTTIGRRLAYFESMVGFADERLGEDATAAAAYRRGAAAAGRTALGRALAGRASRLEGRRPREAR